MKQKAFTAMGQTFLIPADPTAPAGVQVTKHSQFEGKTSGIYRVYNSGSVTVHLSYGVDATDAQNKAVAPIAGTPQSTVAIAPGAVEIIGAPDDTYFSGICSSASSVFICAGEGV